MPTALFLAAGAISVVIASLRVAALGLYRAYPVEPALIAIVLLTVLRSRRESMAWSPAWVGGAVLAVAILAAIVGHRYSPVATPPVAV